MQNNTETIDRIEGAAQDTFRQVRTRVRGSVRQAEIMLEDLAEYVARNPLAAVGWAVAAGVAVGIGVAKLSSPRHDHPLLERVKEGVEAGEKSWRQIRAGFSEIMAGFRNAAREARG